MASAAVVPSALAPSHLPEVSLVPVAWRVVSQNSPAATITASVPQLQPSPPPSAVRPSVLVQAAAASAVKKHPFAISFSALLAVVHSSLVVAVAQFALIPPALSAQVPGAAWTLKLQIAAMRKRRRVVDIVGGYLR